MERDAGYTREGLNPYLPLHTKRLTIRRFSAADADALYELHRSPLVMRHAGGIKTQAESQLALRRLIDKVHTTGFGALALEDRSTRDVLGWCGIQKIRGLEDFEVIYALRHSSWGQGFAYEAAARLIAQVFSTPALGIESIHGLVYPQNLRSIRVLEKLGMQLLRDHYDEASGRHASLYVVHRREFGPAY